ATDTLTVIVKDTTSLNADAGPDQTVNEDTAVTFDGSGSSDDVGIVRYSWDFNARDGITGEASGVTPTHTYLNPGTYTVTLNVSDSDGNYATDTLTVIVKDTTPPITVAGPDMIVNEDTIVAFDGSGSYDNAAIESYSWDFDASNGITVEATGITTTHTYPDPGTYTVTLNVSDSAGNHKTNTLTITVKDITSPIADAGPDQTVNEDTVVHFNSSGSSDNIGITGYSWDFDATNGITVESTGAAPTHTYKDPGTYTVTLKVSDSAGNYGNDSLNVTVKDTTTPIAVAGPDQNVNKNTVVHFDGSGSSDDVGIVRYSWDFDAKGGITSDATGATSTHTYNNPGTYTVTLNVSDSDGKYATDTLIITVKDATTTKSSGGESSGGLGTSGESFKNIICTETDRRFIGKDQEVSYNFNLDCNYVTYVNFTGLISFGKEATKVEILNHTSSLVDKNAPDIVFKNLNVWIGPMGLISETNVEDPTISFYVDKSWVKDNNITLNTITLYSYDDSIENWEKISTRKIGEGPNSYYYKANLPIRMNIGAFAISGINLSRPSMVSSVSPDSSSEPPVIPTQSAQVQATPKIHTAPSPITWTGIWKEKVPHYLIFFAILVITSLYIVSIKWDKIGDTNVKINGKLIDPRILNLAHPIIFICSGYVLLRLILYFLDVTNTGAGWLEGNQIRSFSVMILMFILSLSITDAAVTFGRRRLGDNKYSLAESGISLVVNIKRWKELPSMVAESSHAAKQLSALNRPSKMLSNLLNRESVKKGITMKVPSPIPGRPLTRKSAVIYEDVEHTSVPEHPRPITKKYIYYDKIFNELTPDVDPDSKPDSGPIMEKRPRGP
ncbi:MAG: PKD domain-containing protein, partial [ANME-2 cluster archaeon]|nr:PKD domain-containing protein [ANME-2 cluster archaeon]